MGWQAGRYNTTGCNNLFFGCDSGTNNGLACITTQSNRILMGNNAHACAQIQVAWTVVSDERDKCIFGQVPHGRGFLQKINPVKFAFKDRSTGCLTDAVGKYRYGFKAQEMLAAEGDKPVITSAEDPDKLQLTSDYLVPVLVNAIKELSAELDAIVDSYAGPFITPPVPLANLTAVAGARAFVNDSNLAATGNFGSQIGGCGSNVVPVWSDGTNWYIG